jgi:hypothetical protein
VLENGESREEWRERVMRARTTIVMNLGSAPVKLTRRSAK